MQAANGMCSDRALDLASNLIDVAKVLSSITVVVGAYNYYDHNCFWFAYTAFDVAKMAFKGTLKNWLLVNPGGRGGGSFSDLWELGLPTMFKFAFKVSL